MDYLKYLKILVEEIHSTVIATIGTDGHPQVRAIDMMLYDEKGVYFLTAKGKTFYEQLMQQRYIALCGIRDGYSVSLHGKIENIGSEKLDEIFTKNSYMQKIYPHGTRESLEVFRIYQAQGEFFDIRKPENIFRDSIVIGEAEKQTGGYFINENCIGCRNCFDACPQRCINTEKMPFIINQNNCLHCGRCLNVCPIEAVKRRL